MVMFETLHKGNEVKGISKDLKVWQRFMKYIYQKLFTINKTILVVDSISAPLSVLLIGEREKALFPNSGW